MRAPLHPVGGANSRHIGIQHVLSRDSRRGSCPTRSLGDLNTLSHQSTWRAANHTRSSRGANPIPAAFWKVMGTAFGKTVQLQWYCCANIVLIWWGHYRCIAKGRYLEGNVKERKKCSGKDYKKKDKGGCWSQVGIRHAFQFTGCRGVNSHEQLRVLSFSDRYDVNSQIGWLRDYWSERDPNQDGCVRSRRLFCLVCSVVQSNAEEITVVCLIVS